MVGGARSFSVEMVAEVQLLAIRKPLMEETNSLIPVKQAGLHWVIMCRPPDEFFKIAGDTKFYVKSVE